MRWKLFTLMLLVGPVAFAGPVYKWVDENGVIHYSDQPHENAEKLHLGAPQTYKATQYAEPDAAAATAAPAASYRCAVTSPADQQSFPNATTVGVSATVDPAPSADYQIFVLLDGRVVPGQPTDSLQFTLNVERGEHNVAVVLRDATGKVACQSGGVTFFIQQTSVLAPNNPNNPANQPPGTPAPRPH